MVKSKKIISASTYFSRLNKRKSVALYNTEMIFILVLYVAIH